MNIYLDNDVCFVVTIPGGGTRGVLSNRWFYRFVNEWNPGQPLTQRVNLFAGTSIGAILAAGYAIGKYPDQMQPFFTEEGQWIFTIRNLADVLTGSIDASAPSLRPAGYQKAELASNNNPFYESVSPNSNYGSARLKTVVQSVVGGKTFQDVDTNLYMTAIDTTNTSALNFSNIVSPSGMPYTGIVGQNMSLLDACMSTSAAPVYFPLYTGANGTPYMDGGVDTNNPCTLALTLLKMLELNYTKICVLTICTGKPPNTPLYNGYNEIPIAGLAKTLKDLLSASLNGTAQLSLLNQQYIEYQLDRIKIVQYQFNPTIPVEYADLDLSTPEYNNFMINFADQKFDEDIVNIRYFIDHLENRIP